jgi:hypothetical protein
MREGMKQWDEIINSITALNSKDNICFTADYGATLKQQNKTELRCNKLTA